MSKIEMKNQIVIILRIILLHKIMFQIKDPKLNARVNPRNFQEKAI